MGQIQLKQVTKSFGDVEVIPPLDLTITMANLRVFVGPSGCGKSTLLRLIAGLEDITSGHIEIDGKDATDVVPCQARPCDGVPILCALPAYVGAQKHRLPAEHGENGSGRDQQTVESAASVLNLTDYLDRRPGSCLVVSASGLPLAVRLCVNQQRSCLTSRCRTLTRLARWYAS